MLTAFSRLKLVATAGQGIAKGLPEATEDRDPLELLQEWYDAAEEAGILLPETMALATATPDGSPSVRMVLLKGLEPDGLLFFTNYGSRKARELDTNPRASVCFHWAVLERQIRVSGDVERISEEESEAYFRSRPRGSQIGAWASSQSDRLPERDHLKKRVEEIEARFAGEEVPLPPFWGGYRLRPRRIEFWQGRANRLHDRLVFERDDASEPWAVHRLYP